MKKSEIMVSMPMPSYEELINYKKEYQDIVSKMRECFDGVDMFNPQKIINFDVNKAFTLCKSYLPDRFKNANFAKTE